MAHTVATVLLAALGLVVLLLLAAVINALRIKQNRVPKQHKAVEPDCIRKGVYAQRLCEMLRIPTVSRRGEQDLTQIYRFHEKLDEIYPLITAKLEKVDIDGALLYRWPGTDPSLRPILLMSHMDVVEAAGSWKYPPFSGTVAEGKIWGRGAVDTKGALCAILESVERLLAEDFVPKRDIYVASSCNEEITGDGAVKTVDYLHQRGVRLDLVMDEGGAVMGSPMPGIAEVVAMVGVLEKGRANVKFVAESSGGHASLPRRGTPIARLAAFVNRLEKRPPFKRRMIPQVKLMYKAMAPLMSFPYRLVLGNLWLFGPLLRPILYRMGGQAQAMIASTCVFTMAEGSQGANVIPYEASVTANLRFMPFESMAPTLNKLVKIADRYDIYSELISGYDCCPAADMSSYAYKRVVETVGKEFGDIPVVPYIMLAGTDARHYTKICDCVLRFVPLLMTNAQMKSAHAVNENLDVDSLARAVDYYRQLILDYDGPA